VTGAASVIASGAVASATALVREADLVDLVAVDLVASAVAVGKAGRFIAPDSVTVSFGLFWQRGDMLPGVTP
jgi:hypothetical protein